MDELLHGDCLAILPSLPAQSVDMILCDLPYGNTEERWDSVLPMDVLWREYKRLIKPRCAIVLTAVQPFTSLLVASNPQCYRHEWVWIKNRSTGFQLANVRPMRIHENVVVFGLTGVDYFPIMEQHDRPVKKGGISRSKISFVRQHDGRKPVYTERYPESVLYFPTEDRDRIHPTQKPVALFEYLIRTYTQPGALVLDHCAGSMTTAVACLRTNRHYLCIEQDDEYFAKGSERVAREWRKPVVMSMWEGVA